MSYLKNCWYMAAWASEIDEKPLGRRLLDEPVALFRDVDGKAHAIGDRCPHRFAPLSKGEVSGSALLCPYHGLGFNGAGACTLNPHGPITQGLKVPSYPLIEANRVLWIWMGDPRLADPAKIPDLSFLCAAPDTAFSQGYLSGAANYELFVDNILDLTHADYLHKTTLGSGAFTRTRAKVVEDAECITVRWDCIKETASPLTAARLGDVGPIDNVTEVRWFAPAVMVLRSVTAPHGRPMEEAGGVTNIHVMTPESARQTHYFYGSTRDFSKDDTEFNMRFAAIRDQIFATEDEPLIRAQQALIGESEFWDLSPQLLRIDEGAVRVRRKLAALIASEVAASTGPIAAAKSSPRV